VRLGRDTTAVGLVGIAREGTTSEGHREEVFDLGCVAIEKRFEHEDREPAQFVVAGFLTCLRELVQRRRGITVDGVHVPVRRHRVLDALHVGRVARRRPAAHGRPR
jgi:hypothetical protein